MFEAVGEGHKIMHEGPRQGLDLEELERLAQAATPGPWFHTTCDMVGTTESFFDEDFLCVCRTDVPEENKHSTDNASYVVAACNAVPELIAENRELRERARELEIREVDYIEERDALLCTKNTLERQRDWLAKLLGDLCTTQKDGECPLFYACPASGFGWSCGNAIKEDWIYTAEQAAKEAGE